MPKAALLDVKSRMRSCVLERSKVKHLDTRSVHRDFEPQRRMRFALRFDASRKFQREQ